MSSAGNSSSVVLGKLTSKQRAEIERIESDQTKMYLDFGLMSLHFLDPKTGGKYEVELFIGAVDGTYVTRIVDPETDKLLLETSEPVDEVLALFRDGAQVIGELLAKVRRN